MDKQSNKHNFFCFVCDLQLRLLLLCTSFVLYSDFFHSIISIINFFSTIHSFVSCDFVFLFFFLEWLLSSSIADIRNWCDISCYSAHSYEYWLAKEKITTTYFSQSVKVPERFMQKKCNSIEGKNIIVGWRLAELIFSKWKILTDRTNNRTNEGERNW